VRRLLPPGDAGELDDDALAAAYALDGPHVRVNFVASLDGAITVAGRSGGLQSPGDLRVFELLRATADVVLVGHGTAAAEGYGPVLAGSAVGRWRARLGRPATAPIAVVSRRASLDPSSALARGGDSPTLLLTCAAADPERRAALAAAGTEVLVVGDDDVDLPAAVAALADRGLTAVTCEGGPALFASALAAGVVDELDLTVSPALVGDAQRLVGDLPDVVRPRLVQLLEEDGFLFSRYAV
jgi:riboflavin biosynthesis pyrimidine reductase